RLRPGRPRRQTRHDRRRILARPLTPSGGTAGQPTAAGRCPFLTVSCLPVPPPLPEPFPTSASGSPWGGGEVGNGAGRPPKVVFPGRRDNGCARRAHRGRPPCLASVRPVWGTYAVRPLPYGR